MKKERLLDLAWEVVDGERHDFAVCISNREMAWLLRQFDRGKRALADMRREWKRQETETS